MDQLLLTVLLPALGDRPKVTIIVAKIICTHVRVLSEFDILYSNFISKIFHTLDAMSSQKRLKESFENPHFTFVHELSYQPQAGLLTKS